jgi:hypothetical protein
MIALLIGYESVSRIFAPVVIHFREAIPIACLGLAVNVASAWLLRALSYVDAPVWQEFYERSCKTVGCSHMSGLCARLLWPLALMISAD